MVKVKKQKKKSKSSGTKKTKKQAKSTKTQPDPPRRKTNKREKILKIKMENPDMGQKEIGEMLGMERSAVNKHLCHPDSRAILEEAEKRMRDRLVHIREKALEVLEDIVVRGITFTVTGSDTFVKTPVPPQVRAGMIKLALEGFLTKQTEIQPESIEFETVITEYGTVEQKVKKNYRNLIPKPKKEGNSQDRQGDEAT